MSLLYSQREFYIYSYIWIENYIGIHNIYNEETGKWAEDMSQLVRRSVKIK